jgi:hypothetical protein
LNGIQNRNFGWMFFFFFNFFSHVAGFGGRILRPRLSKKIQLLPPFRGFSMGGKLLCLASEMRGGLVDTESANRFVPFDLRPRHR